MILLAVAYLGSCWWIGGRAQALYQEHIDALCEALPQNATLSQDYRRGLFASRSKIRLSWLPGPVQEGASPDAWVLHWQDDVRHMLFAEGLGTALTARSSAWLESSNATQGTVGGKQALQATTVYRLDGSYASSMALPAGETTVAMPGAGKPLRLWWTDGQILIRGTGDAAQVTMDLGGLRLAMARSSLEADVALTANHVDLDLRWLEGAAPALRSVSLDSALRHIGLRRVSGTGAAVASTVALDDGKLEASATLEDDGYRLNQALRISGVLGDTLLHELSQDLQAQGINPQAIHTLPPVLWQVLTGSDPGRVNASRSHGMNLAWRSLLSGSPQGQVKLDARLGEDSGRVRLEAGLQAPSRLARWLPRLPWHLQLLSRLEGQAKLDLPQGWPRIVAHALQLSTADLQSMDRWLANLVIRGGLRLENGRYVVTLNQNESSAWVLNGRPLGLAR